MLFASDTSRLSCLSLDSACLPAKFAKILHIRRVDEDLSYCVLIVDENPSIHDDFRKILCPDSSFDMRSDELQMIIVGRRINIRPRIGFKLKSAYQGREALKKVDVDDVLRTAIHLMAAEVRDDVIMKNRILLQFRATIAIASEPGICTCFDLKFSTSEFSSPHYLTTTHKSL